MDLDLIDPEMRRAARIMPAPPVHRRWTLPVMRWLTKVGTRHKLSSGVTVEVRPVGPASVYIYRPPERTSDGAVLWIHGGGFVVGAAIMDDTRCSRYAAEFGVVVVSVEYRLAPEHPFPAPLEDVLETIAFAERGGLGAGIDASAIAIAGDSAGANLALAALIARNQSGATPLAAAALFYGCYEPDFSTRSYASLGGGDFLLTTARMQWYWANFLGSEGENTASLAAPSRGDLSGLPPIYLSAAGLDPLRDDTLALATRLAEAGSLFRCDHFPGIVHGCLRMTRELDAARRMIAAGGRYVAHHINDKRAGGIQPWNVANSSS
jgi:acetyl esterase